MKRPKWLGDSRTTKADKQKKARQQTDQRMKHQDAQRSDESKVTRTARRQNGDVARRSIGQGQQKYGAR